jgi:DNA invertase Pin-like site-specific DNA recombinase
MFGIYCRISKEKEEGKDRSINDQKLLGIEVAKSLNLPYKVYIDEGVSGTARVEDRPEFSCMLDDISEGNLSHVYVYDQSRLERNPQVRFLVKDIFKKHNIKLFTDSGEVDLHNSESEMFGDLKSIFNSYSVRETKAKIKSILKRNVLDGKVHGLTPYGYTKDNDRNFIIDVNQVEVIKRIYQLSLEGNGYRTITKILNKEGVPTRYQILGEGTYKTTNNWTHETEIKSKSESKWSNSTIMGIINNPIYKGVRKFGNSTYSCPIIIEPTLWEKVHQNLKINSTKTGKKTLHKYLLNNILICSKCGRRITGRSMGGTSKNNIYRCVGKENPNDKCYNRGISQPILDWVIWNRFFLSNELEDLVKNWFKNTDVQDKINTLGKNISSLNTVLKKLEKSKERVVSAVSDGTLTMSDVKKELERIRSAKEETTIKLVNLKEELDSFKKSKLHLQVVRNDMGKINKTTSFNQKQNFIRKWIREVKIDYYENTYMIFVEFNLPGMKKNWFMLDTKYKLAVKQGYPNEFKHAKVPGWFISDSI